MVVNVTTDAVKITEFTPVHQGDVAVNKCYFILPKEFSKLCVTATFNGIPVPLSNNECYIPTLKKGTATLGVYAYNEASGEVELMYSPRPTQFYVTDGSFGSENSEQTLEISECESFLATYKQQIADEMESKIAVKYINKPETNIIELNTGAYWIDENSIVTVGEYEFKKGFFVLSKRRNGYAWFFAGTIDNQENVWSGWVNITSNDSVYCEISSCMND